MLGSSIQLHSNAQKPGGMQIGQPQQPQLTEQQKLVLSKQQNSVRFKSCDWFQKRIADRKYS